MQHVVPHQGNVPYCAMEIELLLASIAHNFTPISIHLPPFIALLVVDDADDVVDAIEITSLQPPIPTDGAN
jgi:hypothetical protein